MGEFEISDAVAGASERPARTARNIFSILCSFNSYTVTLPSLCNHVVPSSSVMFWPILHLNTVKKKNSVTLFY